MRFKVSEALIVAWNLENRVFKAQNWNGDKGIFQSEDEFAAKMFLGSSASSCQLGQQALLKQEWLVGYGHSSLFHFVERRDWKVMEARAVHEVV